MREKERIRASQQTLKATLLRLSEKKRREEKRREEKGKQKALIENEVIRITRSSKLGRHSNVCEIVAGSYVPQHRF
jgi:hypothetical protein